jgi:radical SAM superfamily enzyme YgiQ (UPF0313 family)
VRGCPFQCNFCSVIKIAGRAVRSQSVETSLASMRAAKKAGVKSIFFTSDNFNKYAEAADLLNAMIDEKIEIPFVLQCDTQIARQPELVELMGRAGCYQMFTGMESFDRETLRRAKKFQNHPDTYADIVRLCHDNGISTQFANIIGFPDHREEDILAHVRLLRELDPDTAVFFTLTPIPGTEQYDDFMREGLITEKNLDRFDTNCVTWEHPHLTADRFRELVLQCNLEFYRPRDSLRRGLRSYRRKRQLDNLSFGLQTNALMAGMGSWSMAMAGINPLLGGLMRVRQDHVREYMPLRRARYGFELASLPKSSKLSARDEELNRKSKLLHLKVLEA